MDEIIKDVRAIREAYAAEFGYDIRALYEDAKSREGQRGHKVVSLKPCLVTKQEEEASPKHRRFKPADPGRLAAT